MKVDLSLVDVFDVFDDLMPLFDIEVAEPNYEVRVCYLLNGSMTTLIDRLYETA
jgi:hypothetical protein